MSRSSEPSSQLEDQPAERLIVTDRGRSSAQLELDDQSLVDENLQEHTMDLVVSSLEAHWSSSPIRQDAPSAFTFPVLGPTSQTEPGHGANHSEESRQTEALLLETKQSSDKEVESPPSEEREDNSRTLNYPALPWGQRTRTRKAGSTSMRLITSLISTPDKTDRIIHQEPAQETRALRVHQKDGHGAVKRLRSGSITSSEGSSRFKPSTLSEEPEAPFDDAVFISTKKAGKKSVLKNEQRFGREFSTSTHTKAINLTNKRETKGFRPDSAEEGKHHPVCDKRLGNQHQQTWKQAPASPASKWLRMVSGCDEWIGVHGNVLEPKAMVWHTSFIKDAVDPNTVMTLTGSLYHLRGSIDEERMRSNGFSQDVVEAFKDGFPADWRDILVDHFNGTPASRSNGQGNQQLDSTSKDGLVNKSLTPLLSLADQTGPMQAQPNLPASSLPSPLKRKKLQEADPETIVESFSGQGKKTRTRAEDKKREPRSQHHRSSLTGSTHTPDTPTQAIVKEHILPAQTLLVAKASPKAPLVQNHAKDDSSVVNLVSSCAPQVHARKPPTSLNLSVHGAKLSSLLANDRPSSLSPTLQLCTKVVMEQLLNSTQGSRPPKDAERAALGNLSDGGQSKQEGQEQGSGSEQAPRDLAHAGPDEAAWASSQEDASLGLGNESSISDTPTLSAYRNGGSVFDTIEEAGSCKPATVLQGEETWPETMMPHVPKDRSVQESNTLEDEEEKEAMFTVSAAAPSTRDSYSGPITGTRAESHPPSSPFKSLSSISAASQSTVLDFVGRSEGIMEPELGTEAASGSLVTGSVAHMDPEGVPTIHEPLATANLYSSNTFSASSIGSLGIFGSDVAAPVLPVGSEARTTTTAITIMTGPNSKDSALDDDAQRSTMGPPEATLDVATTDQQESSMILNQLPANASVTLQAGRKASGLHTIQVVTTEAEAPPDALAGPIGLMAKEAGADVMEAAPAIEAQPEEGLLHLLEQDHGALIAHAEETDVAVEVEIKPTLEEMVEADEVESDAYKDADSPAKALSASMSSLPIAGMVSSHSPQSKMAGTGRFVSVKDLQARLRFKNQRYRPTLKE
ncbi:hypothetical protein BGZ72_006292 [Mortierella alpina]|nr:hypothetical protein BGZ72_006292 [Mortierella alpina]